MGGITTLPAPSVNPSQRPKVGSASHTNMIQLQKQDLGATYEEVRRVSVTLLQDANVQAAVAPIIKDAEVLNLACGNGHYSKRFLELGAKNAAWTADKLRFHVADRSTRFRREERPYAVVFRGCASNVKEMASM